MIEIKFRGKRVDNGEWVYGYYYAIGNYCYIHSVQELPDGCSISNTYRVIPETVGQFTGLRDSKRTAEYPAGQEIYEGDLVVACLYLRPVKVNISEFTVEGYNEPDTVCYGVNIEGSPIDPGDCKVIGNIHDNPKLLEVGK